MSAFREWRDYFSEEIDLCGVQFPGRPGRLVESLPVSTSQIVDALAEEVYPYYKETPVALFGHSFGALVAFEFARRLHALDINLAHLFVSGQGAPHLPDPEPPMRHLPDERFFDELRRRYGGIPDEIVACEELKQLFLPVLRADITLKETYGYTPGSRLKCAISAFGGRQDASVTTDDLDAWRAQTSGAFKLRMFPGNHFFVHNERKNFLRAVAEDLNGSLREFS